MVDCSSGSRFFFLLALGLDLGHRLGDCGLVADELDRSNRLEVRKRELVVERDAGGQVDGENLLVGQIFNVLDDAPEAVAVCCNEQLLPFAELRLDGALPVPTKCPTGT